VRFGDCYTYVLGKPLPSFTETVVVSFTTDSDLGINTPGFCNVRVVKELWIKADTWSRDDPVLPGPSYGLVAECNEYNNLGGPWPPLKVYLPITSKP
jgi:hypothetical protein